MLDGLSLDQLRTFIAAAEEGSFSAAGRRLGRAQSVVSQTITNLEAQLGVSLFERSGRYPKLTDQGRLVLGGVAQAVLDGRCGLGVMGSLTLDTPELVRERLLGVKMVFVVAPGHPLAALPSPVSDCDLAQHIQMVLTDRTELSKGQEFKVLSPRNWRLADLSAKHAFLRGGLGWGGMPFDMVADDIAEGRLSELKTQDVDPDGLIMPMSATYRSTTPPGPAGRWLIDRLKALGAAEDRMMTAYAA